MLTKPVSAAQVGTATTVQGQLVMGFEVKGYAALHPSLSSISWDHQTGTPQSRSSSKGKGLPSSESLWLSIAFFTQEVLQKDLRNGCNQDK